MSKEPQNGMNEKDKSKEKSNFFIALDEIMNVKNKIGEDEESKTVLENKEADIPEKKVNPPSKIDFKNVNKEINTSTQKEATIISESTVIDGSISSKENLVIKGSINGDVSGENDIIISGHIEGDVKGGSTISLKGTVNGNITNGGKITISKDSQITGNANCTTLFLDGKIIGNINASTSVIMGSNSVVKGNVSSKSISIEEGAKIKGSLNVFSDEDGRDE